MDNELFIKITGDISGLQKELKAAQGEIKGLKKEVGSLEGEVSDLGSELDELEGSGKKAGDGAKDLSSQLGKTVASAISLTAALTIGLELLIGFEKSTGFFEEALTGVSKAQREAAEAQRELNEELTVAGASVKGQIAEAEILVGILQDQTASIEEQTSAYNALLTDFPEIVEGLDQQAASTADLTGNTDALTDSLIRQAQVRVLIANLEKQYADLALKTTTNIEDQKNAWEEILTIGSAFSGGRLDVGIGVAAERINEEVELLKESIKTNRAELKALIEAENAANPTDDPNAKRIARELAAQEKKLAILEARRLKSEEKAAAAAIKQQEKTNKLLLDLEADLIDEKAALRAVESSNFFDTLGGDVGVTIGVDAGDNELDAIIAENEAKTLAAAERQKLLLAEQAAAANLFANATAAGVNQIATSLVDSLEIESDAARSFVSGILAAASSLLSELAANAVRNILIKQGEATAGAAVAATETAAAAGPAAAFVLPGLIASLVGLVISTFSGIKFAQGGIVPGGSFSGDRIPALLNSGEMVLNAGQQATLFKQLNSNFNRASAQETGQITVVGEIRGSTILLSSKRAQRNNNRFNLN